MYGDKYVRKTAVDYLISVYGNVGTGWPLVNYLENFKTRKYMLPLICPLQSLFETVFSLDKYLAVQLEIHTEIYAAFM
jgi:hypothetical protein